MACSIRILSEGEQLTPETLVRRVSQEKNFGLTFVNENDDELDVYYNPNRDIIPSHEFSTVRSPSFENSICHFSGKSNGGLSALNLCHSTTISGILPTSDNYFIVGVKNGTFVLTPQSKQTCQLNSRTKRRGPSGPLSVPSYYKDYNDGKWRYVELALVADNSIYKKYKEDEKAVNERLQSIANVVNALYFPLNVRISLVYVDIWKESDVFSVETSGDKTLDHFLTYRKTFIKEHPNDNAHFLTDIRFEAGVVGKAFKGTMCSYDYSGGVDVDHSENAASVGATMAHEMGHNFGMEHDVDYGSTCICPGNHCIMAPATGVVPPTFWSDCSLKYLASSFQRGSDLCLKNEPEKSLTAAKCGNGIVERGEECDCGREVCLNKCCDGKTCKLREEAKCAQGSCCDLETCKPKGRATVCRKATNICDLDEYCNGETEDCPADFYVQDGHLCPNSDKDYCFQGKCGSRQHQCETIWGSESTTAVPQCFQQNKNGIIQGNCGFDIPSKTFFKCQPEDVMCGRLHCSTQSERPIFGDPTTVTSAYTFIRVGTDTHQCHVIKSTYATGKKLEKDPGMVTDGAVCGPEKMCVDAKCRFRKDVNKTVSQCNDNCNWRGVCNNVGNCHCDNGFGGVACEIPGYGGSVNSNTANLHRGLTPSSAFLGFCIFFSIFFVIACIFFKVKRKRNLLKEIWVWSKNTLNLHGRLEPVRRAPPPPGNGRIPLKRDPMTRDFNDITVTYSTNNTVASLNYPIKTPPRIIENSTPYYPPVATLNRVPSVRPAVPPPKPMRPKEEVIEKLYQEKGEELGIVRPPPPDKPLPLPPPDDPHPTTLSRSNSLNRPIDPPPPPPAAMKPKSKSKPIPPAKPDLPSKPPVIKEESEEDHPRLNVKQLAAKLDSSRK